jgi:aryl-alcohol dehydrogenase-like predicted oxidoreductase
MKYRTYPQTDVAVSEVGFGLWTTATGWWGTMSDDDAVALLREAHALGITLFDAADTYGNGRSEEQLARAFGDRRDQVVYSTKFGYDWYTYGGERKGQFEIPQDFSPEFVRFALEQSLRRLQTDVIDIYSVHNARLAQVESDELFALLEDFKHEGKIRTYGVALGPAIGWLVEGCEAARRRNVPNVQMIWNMLEQYPGNEMIRAADEARANTGYQIRVPHSSGMLEGKYTLETTFPASDHRYQEDRDAAISRARRPHPRPSCDPMALDRAARHDGAAERLRPRTARRVRRRPGRRSAKGGRARAHRGTREDELRRRGAADVL